MMFLSPAPRGECLGQVGSVVRQTESIVDTADKWPVLGLAQPRDGEGSLVTTVGVVPLVTRNDLVV